MCSVIMNQRAVASELLELSHGRYHAAVYLPSDRSDVDVITSTEAGCHPPRGNERQTWPEQVGANSLLKDIRPAWMLMISTVDVIRRS